MHVHQSPSAGPCHRYSRRLVRLAMSHGGPNPLSGCAQADGLQLEAEQQHLKRQEAALAERLSRLEVQVRLVFAAGETANLSLT